MASTTAQNQMYAIYLRKSRADLEAESRGQGETLKVHRKTLLDMAAVRGFQIGEIYEEIVSGDTISARPQMQRLLRDLEGGKWAGVLVMDVDRLGRGDSIDQGTILKTFKYSGAKIITVYKTYDPNNEIDEEFFEFNQQIARSEYRRIRRRLNAGREAMAREGRYQSPKPPFGYEIVRLKNQKGTGLSPVPDQAEAVRLMFQLYAYGDKGQRVGMSRIANMFNAMGFRTYSGKIFDHSNIYSMLKNPVYIGKIRWNFRKKTKIMKDGQEIAIRPKSDDCFIVDGIHEPLISEELWNAVQDRLSKNPCHKIHNKPLINPFAGLMFCALCGKAMVNCPQYNRKAKNAYKCVTAGCKTSGIDMECVEEAFLATLTNWLEEIKEAEQNPHPSSAQEDTNAILRRQITHQIETLRAQQDRLHDLLEQGIYDVNTYLSRTRSINERIQSATAELSAIATQPDVSRQQTLIALKPQIEHVLESWRYCTTAAEKNNLARAVVSKIIYHKTHRCFRNENPSDYLTLDIFPISLSKLQT